MFVRLLDGQEQILAQMKLTRTRQIHVTSSRISIKLHYIAPVWPPANSISLALPLRSIALSRADAKSRPLGCANRPQNLLE